MNSDNYIWTNKTPGLHSKTGSEEQLGINQAFLGSWFLPFLSLSEELPGKLTCFPLVSTFTFICIGCFFTLVDEWPFPYSLLTYTGFRKYGFILVSSKTEFLFLFCSHFWADFKVDNRQKDFFFFAILYLVMRLVLSEMIMPLSASELSRPRHKGVISTQEERSTALGSKELIQVYSANQPRCPWFSIIQETIYSLLH